MAFQDLNFPPAWWRQPGPTLSLKVHGRSFCCLNLFIVLTGYNACGLGWVPTPRRDLPPATVRSPLQVGDMEITSHHDCKLPVAAFITRWRNAFFFGNQSLTSRARNLTQMVKQPSFSPNPSNVCVYLDTPFYRIPTIILGRPFSEILELHSRLSLHLACPSEVYIHSFIP